MQIKTTGGLTSHWSEWLLSKILQTSNAGEGEDKKGNPPTLFVGMKIGPTTVDNSREVPKELKIELLYAPATPLRGIYPKKTLI